MGQTTLSNRIFVKESEGKKPGAGGKITILKRI
jgi:hypothetical protein